MPRKGTQKDILFVVASEYSGNDPIERSIQSKTDSRHAHRRVSICLIHTRHVQIRFSSRSSYSQSGTQCSACSPQTQARRCIVVSPGSLFSFSSIPIPMPTRTCFLVTCIPVESCTLYRAQRWIVPLNVQGLGVDKGTPLGDDLQLCH